MNNKTKYILVVLFAVVGNIATIVATGASWILDLECKWVWLVAMAGWSFFVAALADLTRLQTILNDAKRGKDE